MAHLVLRLVKAVASYKKDYTHDDIELSFLLMGFIVHIKSYYAVGTPLPTTGLM